jgi:hypothetical protein
VISAPGTYSNLSFTGQVNITSSNVTLENCLITAATGDWGSLVVGTSGGPHLANVVIKNVELAGAGMNSTQTGAYGIYVPSDSQVTASACNLHGFGSPFTIGDGQIVIEGNYAHDFASGPATHYNGMQYNGGGSADFSMQIKGNYIDNNLDQADAIMLDNDFGAVNNVTVDGNVLAGGDFTTYADGHFTSSAITNISITNNLMGTGLYGYFDLNQGSLSSSNYQVSHTGNVDWTTCSSVD